MVFWSIFSTDSSDNIYDYTGGCGGKGTWGGLMDTDDVHAIDPNDPNYTSSEVF